MFLSNKVAPSFPSLTSFSALYHSFRFRMWPASHGLAEYTYVHMQPWRISTTQYKHRQNEPQACQDNPMEDMRNAKDTVAHFADLIHRLRPDKQRPNSAELLGLTPSPTNQSHKSADSLDSATPSRKSTSKWHRSVGKEWAESPTGTLWKHISNTLEEVAAAFPEVNPTAIQEFIGAREVLDLGAEFVRRYREEEEGGRATEKPYWAAEDLFFGLQAVKQGDAMASAWTRPRPERTAGWDLADHIQRFVLLADAFRRQADREDWNAWGADFRTNVSFYLCILRCFTLRDAKQRQAALDGDLGTSTRRASQNSNISKVSSRSK